MKQDLRHINDLASNIRKIKGVAFSINNEIEEEKVFMYIHTDQ